jgi:hypothetical protein
MPPPMSDRPARGRAAEPIARPPADFGADISDREKANLEDQVLLDNHQSCRDNAAS